MLATDPATKSDTVRARTFRYARSPFPARAAFFITWGFRTIYLQRRWLSSVRRVPLQTPIRQQDTSQRLSSRPLRDLLLLGIKLVHLTVPIGPHGKVGGDKDFKSQVGIAVGLLTRANAVEEVIKMFQISFVSDVIDAQLRLLILLDEESGPATKRSGPPS